MAEMELLTERTMAADGEASDGDFTALRYHIIDITDYRISINSATVCNLQAKAESEEVASHLDHL